VGEFSQFFNVRGGGQMLDPPPPVIFFLVYTHAPPPPQPNPTFISLLSYIICQFTLLSMQSLPRLN